MSAMTLLLLTAGVLIAGCSPTVKIEASDKPIVINMNIKIDHEIRVRVDRELDTLLDNKKGIF
ncbi:MAG: YnbE family lipoprotein [Chlorobium sp.]